MKTPKGILEGFTARFKEWAVDKPGIAAQATIIRYLTEEPFKAQELWRLAHPDQFNVEHISKRLIEEFEGYNLARDGKATDVVRAYLDKNFVAVEVGEGQFVIRQKTKGNNPAPKTPEVK